MDPRIATFAHGHLGLVGRPMLLDLGMSDLEIQHLVRSRHLEVVHPFVYRAPGTPPSHEQALLAACWAAGGAGVASHRSAAWLWGLDGPFDEAVEVSVPRPLKHRPRGVIVHRSTDLIDDDVTVRRGVPVTKPARTLLDLGAAVPQRFVDRAVDDALAKRLVSHEGLLRTLDAVARRGRSGAGRLRQSLAERTDVPSTVLEAEFSRFIRRYGLPEPVYQYELRDPSGRFVARIDAVYPKEGLAIELDGAATHATREALQHDLSRQNRIVDCGLLLYRYTWHDVVGTPEKTANALDRLLDRRRNALGFPGRDAPVLGLLAEV